MPIPTTQSEPIPVLSSGLVQDSAKRVAVEEFRRNVATQCGAHSIEPVDAKADYIFADISFLTMPTVETSIVSLNASSVARDKDLIRSNPGENLFLLIQDQGECLIEQEESRFLARKGDMFLVDSTKPHSFTYGGEFSRQVSMHLPRTEALMRFGKGSTGGLAIHRDDPLYIAMWAVLEKMFKHETDVNPQLMEAFHSLLGAYIQSVENNRGVQMEGQNAVVARALQLIDRHSDDPEFCPSELAVDLGLSPRTLQRHFQQISETPRQRILAMRLRKARARLEQLHRFDSSSRNITSVAYDSGFSDLSYFYRAFHDVFGQRPSCYLKTPDA